jgi:hypothetical protein
VTYNVMESKDRNKNYFYNIQVPLGDGAWGGPVGIATGYGLDDRGVGVRVPVGSGIFISPYRPDRLWGPPILLLSNGHRVGESLELMYEDVKVITHIQTVPRSRKRGSIHPHPSYVFIT